VGNLAVRSPAPQVSLSWRQTQISHVFTGNYLTDFLTSRNSPEKLGRKLLRNVRIYWCVSTAWDNLHALHWRCKDIFSPTLLTMKNWSSEKRSSYAPTLSKLGTPSRTIPRPSKKLHKVVVVLWPRRLVCRVFEFRPVLLRFVDKVPLGETFLQVLPFSPNAIFPPTLRTHSSITDAM
jgi:hypothetical protein